MRGSLLLPAAIGLAACSDVQLEFNSPTTTVNYSVVVEAASHVGLHEQYNRQELAQLVGVDPVQVEWCAAFVNAILAVEGIPGSDSVSRYPLTARSFLHWGTPVDTPKTGDIVIFPRGNTGWQGHVGFYVGSQTVDGVEHWVILGGNQDSTVSYALYRSDSAIGVRRWIDQSVSAEIIEEVP